jgi:hypothetical protein
MGVTIVRHLLACIAQVGAAKSSLADVGVHHVAEKRHSHGFANALLAAPPEKRSSMPHKASNGRAGVEVRRDGLNIGAAHQKDDFTSDATA